MEEIKKTTNLEFNKIITADAVLFFDLDGTLVNSDYANFLSYKEAIQLVIQNGFDLTYNPQCRFNRSCLKSVIPNLTTADFDRIIREKEKLFSSYLHEIKLNKNIVETLEKFSTRNKTVLVTNCREERALLILNHFGLLNKFDEIFYRKITDNEVRINKYQVAVDSLNISPKSIIAFENEKAEIINAINAGIPIDNIIKR